MSFDAELRSVLESQQTEDEEADVRLPVSNADGSLDKTCETLVLDEELPECDFVADTVRISNRCKFDSRFQKSEEIVVVEDDKELKETDEFGIERNIMRVLTEIQHESGLASQVWGIITVCKLTELSEFSLLFMFEINWRLLIFAFQVSLNVL